MNEPRTQFDYLLNAFERASQSDKPAENGYGAKREALFAYVRDLERRPASTRPGPIEMAAGANKQDVLNRLPDLPEMAVNLDRSAWDELQATARCHKAFICSYGVEGDVHLYTAEQVELIRREAVQACIAVCRQEAENFAEMIEGSRDARYDHMADGATTCEESLRALLEEPKE